MISHTIASVRAALATLTPDLRCDVACKGWFVAESGSRGVEVQRCDECAFAIARLAGEGAGEEHVLTDDDILLLPEAWAELSREIVTPEHRERTMGELSEVLSRARYRVLGAAKRDARGLVWCLPYAAPWTEPGEAPLYAWGKDAVEPLLALVALVEERTRGDDQEERHDPSEALRGGL